MARILAVEEEPDIARLLRLLFDGAGHQFLSTGDGRAGLRMVHEHRPDLVVLDLGLTGMDGWSVLERVRDFADLPVLLLSARDRVADKVRGLRAGADDYVTKPFSGSELLARVEALLRRAVPRPRAPGDDACRFGGPGAGAAGIGAPRDGAVWVGAVRDGAVRDGAAAGVYDDGVVRVDHRSRLVTAADREVELTATEFRLLATLVRHAGAVLSLRQLLDAVWDDPCAVGPDRVKFAVLRLRRKLGWSGTGSPIAAVRGVGYRYRSDAG